MPSPLAPLRWASLLVTLAALCQPAKAGCWLDYLHCLQDHSMTIQECKLAYRNCIAAGFPQSTTIQFDPFIADIAFTPGSTVTLSAGLFSQAAGTFINSPGTVSQVEFFVATRAALDPASDWLTANWTSIGPGTYDTTTNRWTVDWNSTGFNPDQELTFRVRAAGDEFPLDADLLLGTSEDLNVSLGPNSVPAPPAAVVALLGAIGVVGYRRVRAGRS